MRGVPLDGVRMPQSSIRYLADAEVLGGLLSDGAEPGTQSRA